MDSIWETLRHPTRTSSPPTTLVCLFLFVCLSIASHILCNDSNINFKLAPKNVISKEEGSDASFDKFVGFIKAINSNSSTERAAYLNNHFDVPTFLRSIALEAITMDFDGYSGTGNNWIITDRSNDPTTSPIWEWTAFDFDSPVSVPSLNPPLLLFSFLFFFYIKLFDIRSLMDSTSSKR